MAKRKTPKKEKIVDLNPKPAKISDDHLNRLRSLVGGIDRFTMDLGRLELQKQSIMKAVDGSHTNIEALRKEFMEEYGTDNINIQDGTIGYESEDPNIKDNGEANKED
tara:strand:- start:167 stop:490 length:324 start_codon:yes stop_codon:yes gene_type:complete